MPLAFRQTKTALLTLLVIFSATLLGSAEWETVIHLKQKYVYADQIPNFYKEYGFVKSSRGSNSIRYTDKKASTKIDFTINSQEVFLNGVKFHFSYPVIMKNGKYLISQIDFSKLIHPILRPSRANNGRVLTTVILDPGHGGKDPGAVNNYGREKNYTLSLARKVQAKLERKGFKVKLTRPGDSYPSLQERVAIANRYENAVFISLHFNAGGGGRADGIETFSLSPPGVAHYGRGLKASDLQVRAGNIQDSSNIALATAIHGRTTRALGAKDRGIRRARYTVLTGVKHPAILFEGGFMTHSREAARINNDGYLDLMAQSIFEGVVLYKNATEKNRRR